MQIWSLVVLVGLVSGCATFISREEKISAGQELMKNVVMAASTHDKSAAENFFSEFSKKYGDVIYVYCEGTSRAICSYELHGVREAANWELFVQTNRCDEALKERRYETSNVGLDGFQRCTSKFFAPFASFPLLKVDTSNLSSRYDMAEKSELATRAAEVSDRQKKQKADEDEQAALEAAEAQQHAAALAFAKTPAGKLQAACEAYRETDGLLESYKQTNQALKEQGFNKRQAASMASGHAGAVEMSANRANEFKQQYKKMTGKDINWKRDCK